MTDHTEIPQSIADIIKALIEPAANGSQPEDAHDPSKASEQSDKTDEQVLPAGETSMPATDGHEDNSEKLLALLAASIRARAQHAAQMRFGAIVVVVSLFALVAAGLPFPVALSDRLLVAGFAVTTLIVGAWHFDRGNRALRRIGEDADEPQQ